MLHVRVIKAKDPAEMGKLAADQTPAVVVVPQAQSDNDNEV